MKMTSQILACYLGCECAIFTKLLDGLVPMDIRLPLMAVHTKGFVTVGDDDVIIRKSVEEVRLLLHPIEEITKSAMMAMYDELSIRSIRPMGEHPYDLMALSSTQLSMHQKVQMINWFRAHSYDCDTLLYHKLADRWTKIKAQAT